MGLMLGYSTLPVSVVREEHEETIPVDGGIQRGPEFDNDY